MPPHSEAQRKRQVRCVLRLRQRRKTPEPRRDRFCARAFVCMRAISHARPTNITSEAHCATEV
eukprot:312279-Pleurochrysis_carterae.AAC.2